MQGFVTANSITDIYYVLSRYLKDKQKSHKSIGILLQLVDIIDVTAKDVKKTFHSEVDDFEDALIFICAERAKIEYIITRNTKGFINSPVPAMTPEDFLAKFF